MFQFPSRLPIGALFLVLPLITASIAAAQENPLIVKSTPGCVVKLGGAITGEYPCHVYAGKSGKGVHLDISGPMPFDPTSADPQPLSFHFIANFEQLPQNRAYRDWDRDYGGAALYAKVSGPPGKTDNHFDSSSQGGKAEITVSSCSPKDSMGVFYEIHGTANGSSPRTDNSPDVVTLDVRF